MLKKYHGEYDQTQTNCRGLDGRLSGFRDPATVQLKSERCSYVDGYGNEVEAQPGGLATYVEQVASQQLLQQLHSDNNTKRPIWTSAVVAELDTIVASRGSISCLHYPHSAEDVALAVRSLGLNLGQSTVGVISSISPWVEHVLRSEGATHVVNVDYNEPIVCSGIDWIDSKSVDQFSTEVGNYDLLVSFSGIEHSGLGRYGDPINPDGDLEAVEQLHQALAPGGYLLLAIPTADRLKIEGIFHRIYGPDRFAQMIQHKFDFVGRVWDGRVFGGYNDVDIAPGLFQEHPEMALKQWQYQNVLILRKV